MNADILSAACFRRRTKEPEKPTKNKLPPMFQEMTIVRIVDYEKNQKTLGTYKLIQEYPFGYLGINHQGKRDYFAKSDFEIGLLQFALTNYLDGTHNNKNNKG